MFTSRTPPYANRMCQRVCLRESDVNASALSLTCKGLKSMWSGLLIHDLISMCTLNKDRLTFAHGYKNKWCWNVWSSNVEAWIVWGSVCIYWALFWMAVKERTGKAQGCVLVGSKAAGKIDMCDRSQEIENVWRGGVKWLWNVFCRNPLDSIILYLLYCKFPFIYSHIGGIVVSNVPSHTWGLNLTPSLHVWDLYVLFGGLPTDCRLIDIS